MHKPTLPLIALAIALSGCSSKHHEVIEREYAWTEAMRAKDTDALLEIMAPDFRLTFEEIPEFMLTVDNGQPVPGTPRWRWLANLEGMSFGPVEIHDIETVEIADDLVAVNMRMYLYDWREASGETIPPFYDLTDVWLNRDGQWRVITRYSRPLDASTLPSDPDFVSKDE
jgi:hypothetical protein